MSPTMVALFLGIFLGANGGILIAALLAANAKQAACEDAYREGVVDGIAKGRKQVVQEWDRLQKAYSQRMEDDIAAAFPKPRDAA